MLIPATERESATLVSDVLARDTMVPFFQPILSVRQRTTIGAEALIRVPFAGGLLMPEWLFSAAAREGRMAALDRRSCEKAIEVFAAVPNRRPDQILFLNLASWPLSDAEAPEDLGRAVEAAGLLRSQIAIEILESRVDSAEALQEVTNRLRGAGFLVVLDDVGTGHSNLDRILLLQPDVIKIDRSLIRNIDSNYHKQETVKCLVNLSRTIGALVVAEGLETEAEALTALELGADLLQGFLLGRPHPDGSLIAGVQGTTPAPLVSLERAFKARQSSRIADRRERRRRATEMFNEIAHTLSDVPVEAFDAALDRALQRHPSVECLYVLDSLGSQLSETIWNRGTARRRSGVLFRPAPRGTDHSAKDYYYVLMDVALQWYVTDPYISSASGHLSRTISSVFHHSLTGQPHVLCIDVAD
jgi:EAL domain-containing protein (putative c-di-GMP-specific phosphodiesterase class I)